MRPKVQVVFDCSSPEQLAAFYASALDYKLQGPPEGFASWKDALKEWGVPQDDWDSASAIIDPYGMGPRIYFQRMDTPKVCKNRLHIDVNASEGPEAPLDRRKAQVRERAERLKSLGAREQNEVEKNGEFWVVVLDPEGNGFCVQ